MRQTKTTVPELIQSINIFFESQAKDKQRVSFQTLMISVCICNKNTKHLSKTSNYCKMLCNSYFFPMNYSFVKSQFLTLFYPSPKMVQKICLPVPKPCVPPQTGLCHHLVGGHYHLIVQSLENSMS